MSLKKSCFVIDHHAKTDVFYLHGFLSSQHIQYNMKRYLQSKPNVNAFFCDARGHGSRYFEGDATDWDQTMQEYNDIITERAKKTGNDIILIGHSMGGNQAIVLGVNNSFVQKAVGIGNTFHDTFLNISLSKNFAGMRDTFPSKYASCKPEYKTKLFFIHNKSDSIVDFSNFTKNITNFCVPKKNTLIFDSVRLNHNHMTTSPQLYTFLDTILPQ